MAKFKSSEQRGTNRRSRKRVDAGQLPHDVDAPLHTGHGFGSVHRVTRELKKEQNSLFNCLSSILNDATFVQEVRVEAS